jgi:hypothetical protein
MFYAIDGDEVGKKLEYYLVSDQVEKAIAYSSTIDHGVERICARLEELGAKILFRGGDSVLAESVHILDLELHSLNSNEGEITWSAGIGKTASLALLALKKAKALGRNQTAIL